MARDGRLFAARRHQPIAHLRQACSAVREGSPHTDPLRMWAKKLIEKKPFKP